MVEIAAVAKQIVASLQKYVADRLQSVVDRLDACEKQLATIEALTAQIKSLEDRIAAIPAGPQGERGEKGERGEDGAAGRDGIDGKDGLPGQRGEKGEPGTPGRDGLTIDVLPLIDETRSYPRGTFARHANGLWRAAGDTDGMRNWECIVAGVKHFAIEENDDRTITIRAALSDDREVVHVIKLTHPIDKGVWREGETYAKGDGVTWGGSWFIAQTDAPTDKPGVSDQWRLAVKRGRDGKDAK